MELAILGFYHKLKSLEDVQRAASLVKIMLMSHPAAALQPTPEYAARRDHALAVNADIWHLSRKQLNNCNLNCCAL